MKKNVLLFLSTPGSQFRKEAFSFLRKNNIPVLAQYGNIAVEIPMSENSGDLLVNSGLFGKIYNDAISEEEMSNMVPEAKDIADAWNLSTEINFGQARAAGANEGLSWGTEGFDEPRPHSEISKDFFLTILQEKGINQVERDMVEAVPFSRERSINSFDNIEKQLLESGIDETRVYHLSRLAIVHPELEEAILNLPEDVIDDFFNDEKTDKINMGAAIMAAPEETCWRMNGEISVGVIFVESSMASGPTFTSATRTTLRTEIQTGLNWLASQHPNGDLSWIYNYQYISINVANGTNSSTEAYWRNPAMQLVNFGGNTYTGNWAGVVNYRNDMRVANDSAHAIVILVTPYATEWHAYAGDARLTLCNRNNWGGWGINTIDTITAHEVCHLFGAADEYTGSGTPCSSCTTTHGCDNEPNGNCKSCANPGVPCVMDQNALEICGFTQRQIGWRANTGGGWASMGGVITSDIVVGNNADGRLEIFAKGTDGAVWHQWQVVPNGNWSGWASLGGVITSSIAVDINADGRMEIFARGLDNAVWHQWQVAPNGTWSGWSSLGGVITSDIAVENNADGRLEIFARGTDDAVWHQWQVAPSGGWSGWASLGGVITSNIAVETNADGRMEIFARGTDNAVWHQWQVAPNGNWSGWSSLGGVITSDIAVENNADGRLEIFARGTDNAVWHQWQVTPSGGWSGWASLGGVITSNIAVENNADGRMEIFARGTDNAVWHQWQVSPGGGWSGWSSLGGIILSNIGISHNLDGRMELFVKGLDSGVWHRWQTAPSNGWS